MKKVLFAAFLTICAQGVFAQINQGQWLVGGSAAFESRKHGDGDAGKSTYISISPNAGYFVIDKLAVGLRTTFESIKFKDEDDASSTFAAGPFVRYYFLPLGDKVNVFADGTFAFGSVKDAGESNGFTDFAISAGPAIFLSPNTALEFNLNYRSAGGDAFGDDRYNRFGVGVGFQIHLGSGGGKK